MSESMTDFARAVQDILTAGQRMDSRGWVPATAGNISRRLADGRIAITRSGGHKGFLQAADVITVDENGKPHRAGINPAPRRCCIARSTSRILRRVLFCMGIPWRLPCFPWWKKAQPCTCLTMKC